MKEFKGCKNYTLISKEELKDIGAVAYTLKHDKTGARVACISCDDDNKAFMIGFKTPQYESTGVPHILEHSVLCGSDKFPVKDAMTEVSKGSLNTFLNAFTYPDRTCYPVASCNDKDFQNLMDVYLDAVFFPRVYRDRRIFMQEGWHFEMEDPDGELTYNGVVYNEMKGVYSSPDQALSSYVQFSLFPDTQYGVESGGDPDVIPDLTYERFLDFHRTLYHPANSRIFLYGDMDIEEKLSFIDREYLSKFEAKDVDPEISMQKAFDRPVRVEKIYPAEKEENDETGTYLTYNLVVADYTDVLTTEAVDVINYALCNVPGAILKKRLIDAGIGNDVYSDFSTDTCQKYFSIVAQDAKAEDEERFVKIVEDTFRDVIRDGFDRKTLEAAITSSEFAYREGDFGYLPKGIAYGIYTMEYWNYSDENIFANINRNSVFEELKKGIDKGLFEKILKERFLENSHKTILVMKPDTGLSARKDVELKKKLDGIKASLSLEERKTIVQETKDLKAYQESADTPEALATIPTLKITDIKKETKYTDYEVTSVHGVKEIKTDIASNGIAYMKLCFDVSDIPERLVYPLGALYLFLGNVDTENYGYGEFINESNIVTGGIGTNLAINIKCDDSEDFGLAYEIKTKVLYNKLPVAFGLISEMLNKSKLDDLKRGREILEEFRLRRQSTMTSSGHSVAIGRAASYISASARAKDVTSGLDFYRYVEAVLADFDTEFPKLAKGMEETLKFILNVNRLEVLIGAEKEGTDAFNDCLEGFVKELSNEDNRGERLKFTPVDREEGLTYASQVQYVALVGNYRKKGLEYDGSLSALRAMLGNEYLWTGVRLKGGAYGVMNGFPRSGLSYFVSYRDPNLLKTVEVYKGTVDYVRNLPEDREFVERYVITAIGDLDSPLTPSMKVLAAYTEYKSELTKERLQKERDELLATTPAKIRSLADYVAAVVDDPVYCTVGGTEKIRSEGELFKEIAPLYKG
ncbi:MAG: insulinase family protein [Lachnospiraceae bacterium]|nr:insulinase family protein [Lachnospiraceae bacterium]